MSSRVRPRRLLRNSRACDFCHKRRIKCQSSPLDPNSCQNCADFAVQCTYSRPSRRGASAEAVTGTAGSDVQRRAATHQLVPSNPSQTSETLAAVRDPLGVTSRREHIRATSPVAESEWTEPLSATWQSFARSITPVIKRLLSVYHETVYPIFPFFDSVRLGQRLDGLEHSRHRPFFCSVMAACALSSARVRDGALVSTRPGTSDLDLASPDMFLAAAEQTLPTSILLCREFDHLRAFALLSLASLQDAKIRAMKMYIGQYFTVLSINQWHDESNWPQDLGSLEKEEWRRLYWSMYTLDVYSSIVWDGCVHYQESQSKVAYPQGIQGIDAHSPGASDHWLVGWNFTTDLYRILEHNLGRLRSRSSRFNILNDMGTGSSSGVLAVTSQDRVNELYSALPAVFKQLQPITGDAARDIYGFQAANIQATMALLRMVYLSLEDGHDIDTRCSVVSDVLTTFHQVPKPYLKAISTPLIYHIGVIGIILGSVMEGYLSESSCRRVRELLLSMADLLESLEAFLHQSAGAGQRLRDLVVRLEEYMENREPQDVGVHVLEGNQQVGSHMPGPALNTWDEPGMPDLSPQFQLPDEFLRDFTWPFAMSNTYLSF